MSGDTSLSHICGILRQKREEMGKRGYQVVVHLVGVRYYRELFRADRSARIEMLAKAGLPPMFDTELMKGAKLGEHVRICPDSKFADILEVELE